MTEPVRVRILGVGMGPQHVTPEVAEALRSVDYVLAADKGADHGDDGLLALRRAIVDAHTRGAVEVVEVSDPQRDRSAGLTTEGYEGAVADWHDARATAYADALRERGGTAAFLVLGDPSLYDSTIRVVEKIKTLGVPVEFDVLPESALRNCSPRGTASSCTKLVAPSTSPPAAGCRRLSPPGRTTSSPCSIRRRTASTSPAWTTGRCGGAPISAPPVNAWPRGDSATSSSTSPTHAHKPAPRQAGVMDLFLLRKP